MILFCTDDQKISKIFYLGKQKSSNLQLLLSFFFFAKKKQYSEKCNLSIRVGISSSLRIRHYFFQRGEIILLNSDGTSLPWASLMPCGYKAIFQSNPANEKYEVSTLVTVPDGVLMLVSVEVAMPPWWWSPRWPIWCPRNEVGIRNSLSNNVLTVPMHNSSWNSPFASVKFRAYKSLTEI